MKSTIVIANNKRASVEVRCCDVESDEFANGGDSESHAPVLLCTMSMYSLARPHCGFRQGRFQSYSIIRRCEKRRHRGDTRARNRKIVSSQHHFGQTKTGIQSTSKARDGHGRLPESKQPQCLHFRKYVFYCTELRCAGHSFIPPTIDDSPQRLRDHISSLPYDT